MDDKEFIKEKKYLEETINVTKKQIDEANKSVEDYKKKAIKNKKFLWQNLSDFSEVEMHDYMNSEDNEVGIINGRIRKLNQLERSLYSPYFGKFNFDKEDIYIGLTNINDGTDSYVYDWRAPIANIYYNFENGNAYYEVNGTKFDGILSGKRQFKIENGRLISYTDTDLVINDELLAEVLKEASSSHMKSIVKTIQREQNEIIRAKSNQTIVIEGVPGSGKTSIALSRIAYMLYNKSEFTYKNIVIFSPSDVFSEYVSKVLPELGEENVSAITFENLTKKMIGNVTIETINNQMKRFSTKSDRCVFFKMSERMKPALDEFISIYKDKLKFKQSIGLNKLKITSSELNSILKESLKKFNLPDALEYISIKLCDLFKIDEDKNAVKLKNTLIKLLGVNADIKSLYDEFLEKNNLETSSIIKREDMAGLIYLYCELFGYPENAYIKHVVIDEAQDYSPFELYLLSKLYRDAKFTLLGDANQSVNPYQKYTSLQEITSIFKGSKYLKLNNSYRSSYEITEFASSILNLKNVNPIRKKGSEEVLFKIEDDIKSDIESNIKRLNKQGYRRVAIITKDEADAKKVYSKIKSKYVGFMEDGILKDTIVLPVYLAKGLEFDAVIIYTDKNNKFQKDDMYLYYIAATRAEQALIVYNQNK